MRRLYLYKKFSENGTAVQQAAGNIVQPNDEVFVVTEHARKYEELDKAIEKGNAGDILFAKALDDLGHDTGEIIKRLRKIMSKDICLVACDMKMTYEHGLSVDLNKAILGTIVEMLEKTLKTDNQLFFHPRNAGRPSIEFPEGWDEKYNDWKDGKISSKAFMSWSGMKKATFYNKLTEYKEMLDDEEAYKNSIKAAQWNQ